MILTCTRILKAPIQTLTISEIKESIRFIRTWINSGNYRYDLSLLINRLKDLEEIQDFGGING